MTKEQRQYSVAQIVFSASYAKIRASLVTQRFKRLPAVWESWVQSLGQEDPLEKARETRSIILVWEIPWTEEPGRLQTVRS